MIDTNRKKQSATQLSQRYGARGRSFARVLAVFFAVATAVALVACEPKGRKQETPLHETTGFKESIESFSWPSEPSHIVALEIAGRGIIRLGLYEQVAPISVAHVVDCVSRGVYDDTLFHRVIKDFMIQGGDPNTRKRGPDSSRGDWGDLRVEDEYQPIHHDRGVVAMANRGRPGSARSQFFIVHRDSHHLDGKYSAFGRVISGMDVVDAIANLETDKVGRWGEKNTPLETVVLQRATLERGAAAATAAAAEPSPEAVGGSLETASRG
ncbi:MAG: peptidylprolyl isomerase [Deltaproteobacteria bacterium]|nr:peptidylprolyl isomerase [Deltaproteobacteria bacterium]